MVEAISAACLLFIWAAEPFAVRARRDEPLSILDRIAAAKRSPHAAHHARCLCSILSSLIV